MYLNGYAIAASDNKMEITKYLLDNGANIEAKSKIDGRTAIYYGMFIIFKHKINLLL